MHVFALPRLEDDASFVLLAGTVLRQEARKMPVVVETTAIVPARISTCTRLPGSVRASKARASATTPAWRASRKMRSRCVRGMSVMCPSPR
jgi:hypothetical protein